MQINIELCHYSMYFGLCFNIPADQETSHLIWKTVDLDEKPHPFIECNAWIMEWLI
jgi:hypothetical protein